VQNNLALNKIEANTMRKSQKFSRSSQNFIERFLQSIQLLPNWLIVTFTVLFLAALTVWNSEDIKIVSPWDVFSQHTFTVLFQSLESIAIVVAVVLYIKESQDRQDQKHYEAWQVIDNAAAAKVQTSYARFKALQDLNKARISLRGLDIPEADLKEIQLPNVQLSSANLADTNFIGATLNNANLSETNLTSSKLDYAKLNSANLRFAILSQASLNHTELVNADFSGAKLNGANFFYADLTDADLSSAALDSSNLTDADLKGVKGLTVDQLRNAKLCRTILPSKLKSLENRDC
jgi:BTB/POZ domain-containing protein KCTD9